MSKKFDLSLNLSKTKVLLFGSKNACNQFDENIHVKLNDVNLEVAEECRTNFRHLTSIQISPTQMYWWAVCGLKTPYPHRKVLSKATKTTLCEALVLSHFDFCMPVYRPCLDSSDLYRLQEVQNSCLRFIHGVRKFNS
ncbi:hypothetical protein HHI36_004575 [Cryptolaemus montrouzieri]|uniref:Uncharacterized protein n=1 Tax=Cryptolaemus montrouzieri TaxID=559131 RepID=A0ABD2NS20_9CUCU